MEGTIKLTKGEGDDLKVIGLAMTIEEVREFAATLNTQEYWKKGCRENDFSQVKNALESNGYKVEEN